MRGMWEMLLSSTEEKEAIGEGPRPRIGVKGGRGMRWTGMKMIQDLCLRAGRGGFIWRRICIRTQVEFDKIDVSSICE